MVNMTVCSRESISDIDTRRQRCAICLGSDCNKNIKLPYFCVLSSLGKAPSCISVASSKWLATSFCSSRAIRFWMRRAIRESRYRTSFSRTKFFLDCEEILDLSSLRIFWAVQSIVSKAKGHKNFGGCRAYLWPSHPQSPNQSRSPTWTYTARTWSIASIGGRTAIHRKKTWCFGGRGVGRRRRRR